MVFLKTFPINKIKTPNLARQGSSKMSVDQIAQNFTQHYYQVFATNRANLGALYVIYGPIPWP